MICYFDTSALIKLYVEEAGSKQVKDYAQKSLLVATSRVAYAEARAAFARAWREDVLEASNYREAVSYFKEEWPTYFALDVSDSVLQRLDTIIEKYPLRGFDALHLASAMTLSKRFMHEDMIVGCWDARLWDCFQQEGFTLIPTKNPGKTQ